MREWIAETTMNVFGFMFPFALLAFAIVVVLVPFAAWRKTRGFAVSSMFVLSYICGITAWLYAAAVTFMAWGWIGLIIGLLIMGVGVVPLAMAAALFKSEVPAAVFWITLGLSAGTYVIRLIAAYFGSKDT